MAIPEEDLQKALRLKHQKLLEERLAAIFSHMDGEMVKEVTVEKRTTAETGYAASYDLKVNGTVTGDTINIPKDWLLSGVTKSVVTAADKAAGGKFENDTDFAVGDKYIDFEFNVKAGGVETSTHIYLNVNDLVDVYTGGNGINVAADNTISAVIDTANANGITVGASGFAMQTVVAGTSGVGGSNGAMLAADKEKLDGVSDQANKTTVTTEGAGTIEIDGTGKTVVAFATDAEVQELINTYLPAPTTP